MKLKLILLALCFSFIAAKAQTWCTAGATWYYTDVWPGVNGYSKYTYEIDTIINNINCKKITHYREGFSWSVGNYSNFIAPLYTYEQNGVAYIYNDRYGNNKFDTLFNMNTQIGDKWRFPLLDTVCQDSLYFIEVLNIGTKVVNGVSLKWLYVKRGPIDPNFDPNGPYQNYSFDTITERFGGCRYDDAFYSFCYGGIDNEPSPCGQLRCYSDSVFGFYSTGISTSCDYFTTSIKEANFKLLNFSIYPNPAIDELNIMFNYSTTTESMMEIHDLYGKLIDRMPLKIGITNIYSTERLPNAIYMVSLYINSELVENKKLILIK